MATNEKANVGSTNNNNIFCGACGECLPPSSFSKKQRKIQTWRRRCTSCTGLGISLQDSDPTLPPPNLAASIPGQETDVEGARRGKDGFPIPPRPIDEIIGRINANSAPKKKIVEELYHALKYEIASENHKKVVEQLASNNSTAPNPPITYETPNMHTQLLFGTNKNDLPFEFHKIHLAKQKVNVLRNTDMGEDDYKTTWGGGDALVLRFCANNVVEFFSIYIGECTVVKRDLWDIAVMSRREGGQYEWPGLFSVLQCPFCGKLACPPTSNNSHVMIGQMLIQKCDDGKIANRILPRLCCRSCFTSNHRSNGLNFGDYTHDSAMRHNVINLHSRRSPGNNNMSVHTLTSLFETSGMSAVVSQASVKMMIDVANTVAMGSTKKTLKGKISKSQTRNNRQQTVVKFKTMKINQCSGCGIYVEKASACSACEAVYYCGRECQKRHWKRHKHVCKIVGSDGEDIEPRPSSEIIRKKTSTRSQDIDQQSDHICPSCKKNSDDDGGTPALCIKCGTFICCGPCFGKPEFNGINGEPAVLSTTCQSCSAEIEKQPFDTARPGDNIRELLHNKPNGRHVSYARFILAQWMLNDTEDITGIEQDVARAKDEYLWLANDCDYAPAQLALASFYDPIRRQHDDFWDGPTPIHEIVENPCQESPFPVDVKLAVRYYNRACEQKLSLALEVVGTWYKNGDGLFPQDMSKAVEMLKEASDMGRSKAMANLARLYSKTPGMTFEAFKLFERAADYGNYISMFSVAQLGRGIYSPEKCKGYLRTLVEKKWIPPGEGSRSVFMEVCAEYGVECNHDQISV